MRKFLVVNMNYLGDALLTTPALAALRRANPDAVIDVVVGAGAAADVLSGNPDIDTIAPRTARGSWGRCAQLFRMLRSGHYTDTIFLPPLPAYAITAFLAGTRERVGMQNRGMNRFLTKLQSTDAVHMADAMVDTMPVTRENVPIERRLKFAVAPDAERSARRILTAAGINPDEPFVAINVGATRIQKRWFPDAFARTVELLEGVPTVLIGAGSLDATMASQIEAQLKTIHTVNLVGKTSVKELAAVLKMASVLVSADSGPMHLATAVGTPAVALFGSTDPRVTGPYDEASRVIYHALSCAPCGNHPTCEGRYDCMRGITAEETVLAVRELLRTNSVKERVELPVVNPAPIASSNNPISPREPREPAAAPRTKVRNVLIVTKFRFIGDTLLATPIFRACCGVWPDARITLLTGKNAKRLLQNNPYLDEIIEFDPNKADKGTRSVLKLVHRLSRPQYDVALILNRSFHSALIPWFSHVRIRAGFDSEGRGVLLTKRVDYDRDKSEVLCYFDILKAIAPDALVNCRLELWVDDAEKAEAASMIKSALGYLPGRDALVGIQPGASLDGKRWSAERFAKVADFLASADPGIRIIVIGGPDEEAAAREMVNACEPGTRARIASFAGRCDLRQSLGLLVHLGLFLGNDTAITHSAVALNAATVALFGPTSAKKWGNYSARNRVIESHDGTMSGISVDDVIAVVREVRAVTADEGLKAG